MRYLIARAVLGFGILPACLSAVVLFPAAADAEEPRGGEREIMPCDLGRVAGNRGAMAGTLWPDGLVYYDFDASISQLNRDRTRASMDLLEAEAGMVFSPRTNEPNYIHIIEDGGNWSYVGMVGGSQPLSMYNWDSPFMICHELVHALGRLHQQSRSDRDNYIAVNLECIDPGYAYNYSICGQCPNYGEYDFESVMHYSQWGFSTGCPTMTCLPGYEKYQDVMGEFNYLSDGDIETLQFMYGLPTGACCISEACSIMTNADCDAMGGYYLGSASECSDSSCDFNVWTVDDDGPADFDNIQAAVDAASDGDEIVVEAGTYTGTGDQVVDMLGKAITLRSSGTPEETVIDGEGARRVILCDSGETAATTIVGFSITGGSATDGGGIYCLLGSSPTISGCTISGNTATNEGGGIRCYYISNPTLTNCTISDNTANYSGGGILCTVSSKPTLTNCTISGNTANSRGGGIRCTSDSNPTLTGCEILNNTAYDGGGIYCSNSNPTLTGCVIEGNTATNYGGGISSNLWSSPTITNCTISDNTANYSGGGIYCREDSSPTLSGCAISGNTANSGGGIYCSNGGDPTLTECTISGNTSDYGGGIRCSNSSPTLTDCTISGNTATNYGGGIYCFNSSPTLTECTISNNTANSTGGGIYCNSSSPTLTDCTISGNTSDYGGGIRCSNSSPTLTDCTISGNTANYYGGGIGCSSSSPTLTDCMISGNNVTQHGGGIYCYDSSNPTLTGCVIEGNTANQFGGGVYCYDSSNPTLTNCTISGNTAPDVGGGICSLFNSNPTLADTAVCSNTPDQIVGDWTDNGGNTIADECPDCPDINGDGEVGVDEILAVIAAWDTDDADADVNDDGIVDTNDILAVLSAWGPCP